MKQEQLQELLSQMSLEEKIGELFQFPSYFYDSTHITGPAADLGLTDKELTLAGSCLSIIGAEETRRIQQEHIAKHPHHIPLLFMADIINGYQTIFPIPLAQSCTFDLELVEECASIAAKEAAAAGIHVTFSPMADLVRDARWGRVMESTGEDPYLNGLMAAAMVRGYQGKDNKLTSKGKLAACLKHFAGYGAPEAGRDYNIVELSERTLREDYLPAYQAAIDAGCALVMTSFNTLNRIPSSGNRWLMRDVLRREMNFNGVVISDWAAIEELLPHGIASDASEAALLAIHAGVDIDMATSVYIKQLKKLVTSGKLDVSMIDEAALRILTLKNNMGLFENPFKDADIDDENELLLCDAHRAAAEKCAESSFVLLKNDEHFLPLKKEGERVAFIGPFVDNKLISGAWSIFGNDEDCITIKQAVMRYYSDAHSVFAAGCPTVNPDEEVIPFQKAVLKENIDMQKTMKEAIQLAEQCDKIIFCLGEHREFTGESASRSDIRIPSCQIKLLQEIHAVNPNIGVVLFNGRPLDIREIIPYAKSILEAWFPGVEGGTAVARTLFGDAVPSGKLTMSFPYSVGQVPVYYNHMNTGRPFHGDYRKERFGSKYMDIPNEPLYPFGFGLSYTSFTCSEIKLNRNDMSKEDVITASVYVSNTGNCTGTETVQLYLHDIAASVTRPVRELKGFQRITLAPGETAELTFQISEDMLRFYDINMEYRSEPGDFELFIGTDSTTDNSSSFTLKA